MVSIVPPVLGAVQTFLFDTLAVPLSCMDVDDDCSLLMILMMM
jgi:hypothetical protein